MIETLLARLNDKSAQFSDVLAYIEQHYDYTPSGFQNGTQHNASTQNQGSAKVLAFAQLHQLDREQTLQLFAEHYQAVLDDPQGEAHQNIRQFMQHGWSQVNFEHKVLSPKA